MESGDSKILALKPSIFVSRHSANVEAAAAVFDPSAKRTPQLFILHHSLFTFHWIIFLRQIMNNGKWGGSWRSQIAPTAFDGRYSVTVGQVPALQVTLRYGAKNREKRSLLPVLDVTISRIRSAGSLLSHASGYAVAGKCITAHLTAGRWLIGN